MNSWITALAFAGKCGGFGARGPVTARSPSVAAHSRASNPASAILPTPRPHAEKK